LRKQLIVTNGKRKLMASSLDKLRALTDKLEDKLIEKQKGQLEVSSLLVVEDTLPPPNESVSTIENRVKDKSLFDNIVVNDLVDTQELNEELSQQVREENIVIIEELYNELKIFEKSPDFDNIFIYKAMNLSGIGLKEEDFAEVRAGKYIQVIAITYEPDANGKKKAKNISLGYFGKGDTIDPVLKNKIIEFVLRWRYEKAFQNVQHYKELIAKLQDPTE